MPMINGRSSISRYLEITNTTLPKRWMLFVNNGIRICLSIDTLSASSLQTKLPPEFRVKNALLWPCASSLQTVILYTWLCVKKKQMLYLYSPPNLAEMASYIELSHLSSRFNYHSLQADKNIFPKNFIWTITVPKLHCVNLTFAEIKVSMNKKTSYCPVEFVIKDNGTRVNGDLKYCGTARYFFLLSETNILSIEYNEESRWYKPYGLYSFSAQYQITDPIFKSLVVPFGVLYIFTPIAVINNFHGYQWTIYVNHISKISITIFQTNLPKNTSMIVFNGPGERCEVLFDPTSGASSNTTLHGNMNVAHIVIWSKYTPQLTMSDFTDGDYSTFIAYSRLISQTNVLILNKTGFHFKMDFPGLHNHIVLHRAYKLKASKGRSVEVRIRHIHYSGSTNSDCATGGLTLHNNNGSEPIYAAGLCGQQYLQHLLHNSEQKPSFISSSSSFTLAINLHRAYHMINISLLISITKCQGIYPMGILADPHLMNMEINVPEHSILNIQKDNCVQLHSSVSRQYADDYHEQLQSIYSSMYMRKRLMLNRLIIVTCDGDECELEKNGFKVVMLSTRDERMQDYYYKDVEHGIHYDNKSHPIWHYILHIGQGLIIGKDDLLGIDAIHDLLIVHVSRYGCIMTCGSLPLKGRNTLPYPVYLNKCDICHDTYTNDVSEYYLQVGACFKVESEPGQEYSVNIFVPEHLSGIGVIAWSFKRQSGIIQFNVNPMTHHVAVQSGSNNGTNSSVKVRLYPSSPGYIIDGYSVDPQTKFSCNITNNQTYKPWKAICSLSFRYELHGVYNVKRIMESITFGKVIRGSWDEAEAFCQYQGGHLVSIHNAHELNMMKTLFVIKYGQLWRMIIYIGIYSQVFKFEPIT